MERACSQCQRTAHIGYNKPHSLHRTKRVVRPNLQMVNQRLLCTRCQRTETKRRHAQTKFTLTNTVVSPSAKIAA